VPNQHIILIYSSITSLSAKFLGKFLITVVDLTPLACRHKINLMIVNHEWTCQWDLCTLSFPSESELFTHLRIHTSTMLLPIICKWSSCVTPSVYTHRGHLNDHIVSHMSRDFVLIKCASCRAPFRNRQALSRHQKSTVCIGSYHGGDISTPGLSHSSIVSAANDMIMRNSIPLREGTIVRGRSLDNIIREQSQGITNVLTLLDLLDIVHLYSPSSISQLPQQIITTGTQFGIQAVLMRM
jgi:hypothetical protein